MATTEEGIYYPDDYTKSADILADMKQMAESVDKVIQKEKENQETTEQKIEEIDDNQIHVTTEKAENLNIKDASGQNAKIKLFGVSKQKIREGYNLLNIASKFEAKGRSNAIAISLKTGVTYTVKADNIETNNENPTTLAISFRNASDVSVRDLAFSYNSKKATFQVTGEATKVYIYSADNYNNSQNITTTYTNLMICEGTDDKEYEAYGASPSPEFPSKIENTTGNVEITDCNKNIANAEEIWENMHNYASSLCSEVIEDNKECIQFSNHAFRADLSTNPFNLINYKYKENVAYTIRMLVKRVSGSGSLYVEAVYSDGTKSNISVDTNEWAELRLVTNSSKTVARIGFSYSGITQYYLDKSSIFIAEGDTTDYIENEQQTITFPLQNQKMMEGSRTEDDGIHHKRKQITLTGNEQIVKYTKTFPNGYGYRVILNDVKANTEVLSSIYNYEKFSNFYWSSDITNKITTHDTTGGYVLVGSSKATIEEFRQEIANSVLEYETIKETIEVYTEEQQTAYNQLQNAKTYKTVTNVFTENAELQMEYVAHTKTYIDNEINSVKEELNTIKELLSTTTTSAMLLDNMQTDLESEVL